jgi:antitoxin component YwqK of YwqJK toxin-antitoxin module
MKRYIWLLSIVLIPLYTSYGQEDINRTDEKGLKQGHWIKKYDNGQLMYEGYFEDNKPIGEFMRYDREGNLTSILIHKKDNDTIQATFYHPNGYIAGKGKFFRQEKTGEWLYYSDYLEDHLLMRCTYQQGKPHGVSIKYHWNGEIAEELQFSSGKKSGSWKQYYTDGTLSLESSYREGKLNGEFKSWHTNGSMEISGQYNNDTRVGLWLFYNKDGSIKKEIKYNKGIPENRAELIREETEYLDRLEKEGGKLNDPEITGIIKVNK